MCVQCMNMCMCARHQSTGFYIGDKCHRTRYSYQYFLFIFIARYFSLFVFSKKTLFFGRGPGHGFKVETNRTRKKNKKKREIERGAYTGKRNLPSLRHGFGLAWFSNVDNLCTEIVESE